MIKYGNIWSNSENVVYYQANWVTPSPMINGSIKIMVIVCDIICIIKIVCEPKMTEQAQQWLKNIKEMPLHKELTNVVHRYPEIKIAWLSGCTSILFISNILEWISSSLEVNGSTFFVLQNKADKSHSWCVYNSLHVIHEELNPKQRNLVFNITS